MHAQRTFSKKHVKTGFQILDKECEGKVNAQEILNLVKRDF